MTKMHKEHYLLQESDPRYFDLLVMFLRLTVVSALNSKIMHSKDIPTKS